MLISDQGGKYDTWLQVASVLVSCEFESYMSASQSLQVASLQVACLWVIGRCAHFNVKLHFLIIDIHDMKCK